MRGCGRLGLSDQGAQLAELEADRPQSSGKAQVVSGRSASSNVAQPLNLGLDCAGLSIHDTRRSALRGQVS